MSEQSRPNKKQKIEPRTTTGPIPASRATHYGSQSIARVVSGIVLPSDQVAPTSVYPTPSQTVCKQPGPQNALASEANPVLAPNFDAALQVDLEIVVDSESDKSNGKEVLGSKSDELIIIDDTSDECKEEDKEEEGAELDEPGEGKEAPKNVVDVPNFRNPAELEQFISSLRSDFANKSASTSSKGSQAVGGRLKTSQASKQAAGGQAAVDQEAGSQAADGQAAGKQVVGGQAAGGQSSKGKSKAVVIMEEANDEPMVKEAGVIGGYQKTLVRAHALKCLAGLCNIKLAQHAATLVPLYNDAGQPEYFNEKGHLIPHFDRPFRENFEAWGEEFYKRVTDPSRMHQPDRTRLLSVPRHCFRDALSTGGFASMKTAWEKNRDGKGDVWMDNKKRATRRTARKTAKGGRRGTELKSSGLDIEAFGFLAEPAFQSSEYSDAEDKTLCVIQEPAYRTDRVIQILDAIDVGYKAKKKRAGNQYFTKLRYCSVNVQVPLLRNGLKVPGYVIDGDWKKGNKDLERRSRPYIDSRATEMPQNLEVDQYVHEHEPNKRKYLFDPESAPTSEPVIEPEHAMEPEPELVSKDKPAPAPELITRRPNMRVVAPATELESETELESAVAPAKTTPALEPPLAVEPVPETEMKLTKTGRIAASTTAPASAPVPEPGSGPKSKAKRSKGEKKAKEPKNKKGGETVEMEVDEGLVAGPSRAASDPKKITKVTIQFSF
ncbi:hypothetical protein FRC08_006910 [Ceratobasidium sp. 394]|nr:hypothetical protein FRC08_006910 [Ceratobasidium sp. 394]